MKERDCDNCIHQKEEYSERLRRFVVSCDSWECEFKPKDKEGEHE